MSSDRDVMMARQQEVLETLDAIHARCARGEITAAEADALHQREVDQLELEAQSLRAVLPRRWRVGPGLRLALTLLAVLGFYFAVYYFREYFRLR